MKGRHKSTPRGPSQMPSKRYRDYCAAIFVVVVAVWFSARISAPARRAMPQIPAGGFAFNLSAAEREAGGALRGQVLQTSGTGRIKKTVNASFFVAERLASATRIAALLGAAAAADDSFYTDADSIDGAPSFEIHALQRGEVANVMLYDAFEPLRAPLVTFVRRVMGCPACELCDVLVRRYRPSERRGVPVHRDVNAYATAILTLNAEEFTGGYFITDRFEQAKSDSGVRTKHYYLPVGSGDVFVHNHDVLHGVNVTSGVRVSVVGWFKDRPGYCASDGNPWVHELAEAGDAKSMNTLAETFMHLGEKEKGLKWHSNAAEAGHPASMVFMGQGVFKERGAKQRKAADFLLQAAKAGRRDGMAMLAWALDNGAGIERDGAAALAWRRKAAHAGHPMAIRELEMAGLPLEA